MSLSSIIQVSAPGRICLFGDHQDFLGLAVIAGAIDRRITIVGAPRTDRLLHLYLPDIGQFDAFDPGKEVSYRGSRDYLRSVTNVIRRAGVEWRTGFDCTVTGTIPINAGVSSSSALVIAWAYFLMVAADPETTPDPVAVARIGHRAEVLEFNEPGGMMDHYTSAMGGLVYIDCGGDISVERIGRPLSGFVLGDSLEPKDTMGVLKQSKEDTLSGVRMMQENYSGFHFRTSSLADVEGTLKKLPERERRKIHANLVNWEITCAARHILAADAFVPETLGTLMDRHHEMLRDGIGVSTPKIERMIEAARRAGALGAKVNGSGGGGTMIAYAPGREEPVTEAINRTGGRAGAAIIDSGARRE